ncbi:MAG: hypothetical protein H7281_18615 [Bacteriovorax sp.]|nr:hypothetical protein [Bacteriovorax sp.]
MKMMKKILLLIVFVSFYQGIDSAYAEKTQGELAREQAAKDQEKEDAENVLSQARQAEAGCVDKNSGECARLRGDVDVKEIRLNDIKRKQGAETRQNTIRDADSADAKKAASALCTSEKAKIKAAIQSEIKTGKNENQDGDSNNIMKKCVKLSGNNMRYLYKNGHRGLTIDWNAFIAASDECINDIQACKTDTKPDSETEAKHKACAAIKTLAPQCDGAAYIISAFDRDYENSDHAVTKDLKGGNPTITCKGVGISTLDYEACVKFVQNSDIMDAAQGAIQTGQDLYYKDQAMTAQMQAASSTDSATAGLKALKTGVKGQEDIMTQRAALDTGKFAALATYYSEVPTREDLIAKCTKYKTMGVPAGLPDTGCEAAVARQQDFGFLMNQQAREKMKAKLAAVGINVASDALMASLMAKRAGDIDNAIAKVDAFKPIDPLAPAADNLQTTYCQQNPGDAKCLTGGLERTFDAMGDNVISFGEGGTGTIYANKNPALDGSGAATTAAIPTAKTASGAIGSVISSAQQKGGLADSVAKATVTKGSAPSGGGGGGGSSGGGGGGGGGAPPGQQAGGVSNAIAGRAPNYGGGTGTLSMMGGYGIKGGKTAAKDDGNPFGKLFNKDASKSGSLDFGGRSPASVGTKGDNLFDMISKRYTNVNSSKRLLEYEMTK